MSSVSERIKILRQSFEFTQEQLGKAAGVSKAAVSQWERDIAKPERDALLQMQYKLRVNPSWVTEGKGEMLLPVSGTKEEYVVYADNSGSGTLNQGETNAIILIDEAHHNINKAWALLSPEGQSAVLALAEHLIKTQPEDHSPFKKTIPDHSLDTKHNI